MGLLRPREHFDTQFCPVNYLSCGVPSTSFSRKQCAGMGMVRIIYQYFMGRPKSNYTIFVEILFLIGLGRSESGSCTSISNIHCQRSSVYYLLAMGRSKKIELPLC